MVGIQSLGLADDAQYAGEISHDLTRVVWPGGEFSFEAEKERVKQAIYTRFPSQDQEGRIEPPALVIILESHAQIFFQSGARSVIPFQFEVERAFALHEGLILQRRQRNVSRTSDTPVTPTKASHNSNSPSRPSPILPPAIKTSSSASVPGLVKELFDSLKANHVSQAEAEAPFHYHLADPFDDLGVLGSEVGSSGTPHGYKEYRTLLSRHERLIYVSNKDEALPRSTANSQKPLQLAVTLNSTKKSINVWQVLKPTNASYWRPNRRSSGYDGDSKRRRRSSQPGTGAVTPNTRQSIGARDTFGGNQESFADRNQLRDDGDLAAKLDPAFQNPRAPGHSSRRISSMLVRSDLAGMDIYHDGPAAATVGARRGTSFGGPGRSFWGAGGDKREARISMLSDMAGEVSEDDDEEHNADSKSLFTRLMTSARGVRVDLRLVQLYSVALDLSKAENLSVFSISSTMEGDTHEEITVCIHNRESKELHLVEIQAAIDASSWQVKIARTRRAHDILDVCLYKNDLGDKLAILSRSQDGSFEVTLQAPHSVSFKTDIPSKVLINFPFSTRTGDASANQDATGRRRLADHVPRPLQALRTGNGERQIIIIDGQGQRHLFDITIQPASLFVRRCITLCEIVWRPPKAQKQRFLQAWWEIVQLLKDQGDSDPDQEWKALATLILGLCAPLDSETPSKASVRQKRKSGGLLRSSSGAVIDLESYNLAVARESRGSAQPQWALGSAWSWALEETNISSETQTVGLGLDESTKNEESGSLYKPSTFLLDCLQLGRDFLTTRPGHLVLDNLKVGNNGKRQLEECLKLRRTLLVTLHFLREDSKLDKLLALDVKRLCPILAQLGGWLQWNAWSWNPESYYMTEDTDMDMWVFDKSPGSTSSKQPTSPPSVIGFLIEAMNAGPRASNRQFSRLRDFMPLEETVDLEFSQQMSRISQTQSLLASVNDQPRERLAHWRKLSLDHALMETLPEGIAVTLRSAVNSIQSSPEVGSVLSMAALLDRPDLEFLEDGDTQIQAPARSAGITHGHSSIRDYHAICRTMVDADASMAFKTDAAAEMDRHTVTRLIFKDDHRVLEAQKALHPLEPPMVRCMREPEWSEHDLLEAEQELAKVVAVRTLSVSAGRGLLLFGARSPLLTERFPTHGFTLSCVMKPSNNTVTAEKETFTEEKVSWAFFHAGAEAGLSISRNSKGIDTSWIVFNKPPELNNRHAGFLLALGLNGHLKNIAKWVAFKYLTPKHTMTSVGLLLGLAASYLGTMDTLITRLLSVHVTRMLPPGAAELNLSPLTQTTGILALGLLYCNTQHRRMTEVMLSEMENTDEDENESPLNALRDEGYRLAAGFALGFINLGQGKNLKGLHDMHIVERLLVLSVSTKQVELMHVLDKGTAAGTIAIALIFMKTGDEALARKIDIPDTPHQFEYIRPDLFLLRTVAKHLILWNKIEASAQWIRRQLPTVFQDKHSLRNIFTLDIKDLPVFNTMAGLCILIGLRFAGTANNDACRVLLDNLDQFMRLARSPVLTYDHRLTRTTVRNCQDVIALAAATVMAGTGNIDVFRRLRSLHGRTDPDTTYGSHLAAHQAIGVLFLAGGTHTFNTSNLAVASLLCAFYPLFPAAVLDNKVHLQAFRHLWVLAAEPRCVVVRDIDTHKPISIPITITLKTGGTLDAIAPCLLPDLDTVATISLADPKCWPITLDFANPAHRRAFARHQSILAAKRHIQNSSESTFVTTMQAHAADADAHGRDAREGFQWIFDLPSFRGLDVADRAAALPRDLLVNDKAMRTTSVDDRLVLRAALKGDSAVGLMGLKALFAWSEKLGGGDGGEGVDWLEREVVGSLKAELGLLLAELDGRKA